MAKLSPVLNRGMGRVIKDYNSQPKQCFQKEKYIYTRDRSYTNDATVQTRPQTCNLLTAHCRHPWTDSPKAHASPPFLPSLP